LQKERGAIEKMLKKHRKNMLQSKSIEKKVKHAPLQNKSKRRIS
jgi:hypothetical protein